MTSFNDGPPNKNNPESQNPLEIRGAGPNDFDFIFLIKSEPTDMFWTGHDQPPNPEQMRDYFNGILKGEQGSKRKLLILVKREVRLGYIYLDQVNNDLFEISIAISNAYWGNGYATNGINLLLCNIKKPFTAIAWILDSNLASQKVFLKNGFEPSDEQREIYMSSFGRTERQTKFILRSKGSEH